MAGKEFNIPGRFFIDTDECVICGDCEHLAPEFFGFSDKANSYAVVKQPATLEEIQKMEGIVKSGCPVDCIYDDRQENGGQEINQGVPSGPILPSLSGRISLNPPKQI